MTSAQIEEWLVYLTALAKRKYADCPVWEDLIQETLLAAVIQEQKGAPIQAPKAWLSSTLSHKYNDWLRQRYGRRCEFREDLSTIPDEGTHDEDRTEEYEIVRREIGRLMRIHREVIVRHYLKGQSVDRIADELQIPRGTVLSRLSHGRAQVKEGLKMEKYTQHSYEPKSLTVGIWGYTGMSNEPFRYIDSPMDANALILTYEKPRSIKEISDAMGIPCPYLEPCVEGLVNAELMGRTPGGLVYTRCFMQPYEESFGDVAEQEALAEKHAKMIWKFAWSRFAPLTESAEVMSMNDKQKATLLLFFIGEILQNCISKTYSKYCQTMPKDPPERPNGGRWLASCKILDYGQLRNHRYDGSGPVQVGYSADGKHATCRMFDYQSLFGDGHWGYASFPYRFDLQTILRFYVSLLNPEVTPNNNRIYEVIPQFESMHILRRDTKGNAVLDIPALPWKEDQKWFDTAAEIEKELYPLLEADLGKAYLKHDNHVPKHVDAADYYKHDGALSSYKPAQLLAIVEQGLLPWDITVGKNPIIYISY